MILRKLACALALNLAVFHAQATDIRDNKYPASTIPAALKVNANVVVRDHETVSRITSRKSMTTHFHKATTILNANGKSHAVVVIYYDKLTKIKDLRAVVYDANGEVIKKLKSNEIIDRSAFDGFSLFSDHRLKAFELEQSTYPYTVEYEYDLEYDFLYGIDGAEVTEERQVSVENFSYQLIYPLELKPRYKSYNIDQTPVKSQVSAGVESLKWTLKNQPPLEVEPMAPLAGYVKRIAAAPSEFEYEGYVGNMSTWQDYGKWLHQLNVGRDKLPEATKKKVREITKNMTTDEQKIRAIYEYLQSRTRYVSIQLGIGGLQTFEASTVDQNGYGDCKALSNYMVAMLKEVGIRGIYTTVRAGKDARPVDTTFPSHQSNHVIVAVPNKSDTLWLECTSQTDPFGYIGDFTDNRYALMITENGGVLVRTRKYPSEQNIRATNAVVTLDLNGNATAKVKSTYSGLEYEQVSGALSASSQQQKEWLQESTDIPNFNLGQFSVTGKKEILPTATVQMDLTLNKYASVSNKRLFVVPNLLNRSSFVPEKVENRKAPFLLRASFTHVDSITFKIPENVYPEFLPANSKFTSRFGTYESGYKVDQGVIIYYRKMTRTNGEFPAENYQELVDFYKNVNKADNTKIVFLNKT